MARNKANLRNAIVEKNDEFYTRIEDIENELKNYRTQFKGKTVFCNCDDPSWSNFWKFFEANFDHFGLERLISTHYEPSDQFETSASYKLEISRTPSGKMSKPKKTMLKGDGDFRSPECAALLKEADIVVSNPPFKLFREYVAQLMQYKKKFLIIGPFNATGYREIFPLIKDDKIWLGTTSVKEFIKPDGKTQKFGNINWFTNLSHKKRNEELVLTQKYKKSAYPKYDHFDAIEVSLTKDIPVDYKGLMGVPISFLGKHNPEQFEIVDCIGRYSKLTGPSEETRGKFLAQVNGEALFLRVIVRNKQI